MTTVLTATCATAATLLRVPHVTIWRADEATQTLTLQALSNAHIGHSFPKTTLHFGQGGLGWEAQHRQSLHIPDVFADGRLLTLDWWRTYGFCSCSITPIVHQKNLLGVLNMIGKVPFCFSPDDRWLLEQLLAQAAASNYRSAWRL